MTLNTLEEEIQEAIPKLFSMAKELTWDKIKSSLDNDYRKKVFNDPPMLHLKVAIPPWATDKKEKFNINWEHNEWLTKCDTTNIS